MRVITTRRHDELLAIEADVRSDEATVVRLTRELELEQLRGDVAEVEAHRLRTELAEKTKEAAEVETVRCDVRELKRAAEDPATASEVQGRIAVTALRELLEKAEREAAATGAVLDPWYQLIAIVLDPARSGEAR